MFTPKIWKIMNSTLMISDFINELVHHPHRDELIELMHQQIDDMNSVKYLEEDGDEG
jgi:hypothetical protein